MTSLRDRYIRIVLTSGVVTVIIVVVVTLGLYFAQLRWSADQIASELEKSTGAQNQEMAASFLLPEQSAGRRLLLEKYRSAEKLDRAEVITPEMSIPAEFSGCARANQVSRCESADGRYVAILAPIVASELQFGHILKAKTNSEDGIWFFRYALAAVLAVVSVVSVLGWQLLRLHAKVARSLSQLEGWTSEVAVGNESAVTPNFEFPEVHQLGTILKSLFDRSFELQKQAIGAEIAKQVAHDIRSPVHSLGMLIGSIRSEHLSAETRSAIQNSTQRICEIAESLLTRQWSKDSIVQVSISNGMVTNLESALKLIADEKGIQLAPRSNIRFTVAVDEGLKPLARIDAREFKRALSNILNNAIEAVEHGGEIRLSLSSTNDSAVIVIRDSGRGIPPEILARLGEKGLSFGRSRLGTGLGVYHAMKTIRGAGGTISYQSKEFDGTTVQISLPLVSSEMEDADVAVPVSVAQIVVIDDDPAIHQYWEERFKERKNLDLLHFFSYDEVTMWYPHAMPNSERLFLVDYELSKTGFTGLDLIAELRIQSDSILVTSRADDENLKAKASEIGLRVLSKNRMESLFRDESVTSKLA